MLRWNPRDLWLLSGQSSTEPRRRALLGLAHSRAFTAGVISDAHEARFGHDPSPHRSIPPGHNWDSGPHLSCLIPTSTQVCHPPCLAEAPQPLCRGSAQLSGAELLPDILRVKSLQSWMYKTTLFPSAIPWLYGLFPKCLVTWELIKTNWASPTFNPLLLWQLSFKIFWVFPPLQLLTAILLWINVCSFGPAGGSSVHNCSIYSSSSHFFLISSWFQAAPDPVSLTGFFSLSFVWLLWWRKQEKEMNRMKIKWKEGRNKNEISLLS